MAQVEGVPLFEIAMQPLITGSVGRNAVVQMRMYESEPDLAFDVCIGHWAGIKDVPHGNKRASMMQGEIIREQQNAAMRDAMSQFRSGSKAGW
ncbi:hypothetical protein KIMH_14440 [Bombiscardovia apis]|uniref:Uncharacterized protein n=1 Tax=Bombiscardovia apis TaxID=2932182 RepID=A0ABN6SJQ3_9BIFI|nr:hypothetical protein [Bombiscardovia apis]BDR55333.1 hypothetical protein KIMH_14440 [Bombiscardovia apis]